MVQSDPITHIYASNSIFSFNGCWQNLFCNLKSCYVLEKVYETILLLLNVFENNVSPNLFLVCLVRLLNTWKLLQIYIEQESSRNAVQLL